MMIKKTLTYLLLQVAVIPNTILATGYNYWDSNNINYDDQVYLQVNNMDSRWLSGGRGNGNEGAITRDVYRSAYEMNAINTAYKWTIRSTPGDGKRSFPDPKKGRCLEYGDIINLQVNNMDKRWLSGGRGTGNEGAITRDKFGSDYERVSAATSYEWIVKKYPGDGTRP